MKKLLILFAALVVSLLPTSAEESKWWDHELTFETLPSEQDPPWNFRGKDGQATVEGGKLILTTMDETESVAFTLDEMQAQEAVTVEFRVKARETRSRFAGQFNILTNGLVYVFPITNAEELTYRAVLENGSMILYKEGDSPQEIAGVPDLRGKTPAQLLFGDASSAAVGVTEWSELRWAWGKAVHGN